MKPIDWWFRGNEYHAAIHFEGAAGFNGWSILK
jgi:hypothetical protein